MRPLFVSLVFAAVAAAAPAAVFDYPVSCRKYDATFRKTFDERSKLVGARIVVTDRDKQTIFEGDLAMDVRSARWTPDERYLIITGINGAGHSPWHFFVDIFSVAAHEIREIDDSDGPPIVSSEIFCQQPNTIILIGHTFAHEVSAPDDPVLLRFNLDEIWPKLKKT